MDVFQTLGLQNVSSSGLEAATVSSKVQDRWSVLLGRVGPWKYGTFLQDSQGSVFNMCYFFLMDFGT